jgi:hypothetical protein
MGLLLHFPLGFKKNRPIFCALLGFIPVIQAVRGFYCVWASDVHTAMIWGSTSLTALAGAGGPCSKVLGFLSFGGIPKFFSQFFGGSLLSESMLCTCLG